jgi:hypothetical protein
MATKCHADIAKKDADIASVKALLFNLVLNGDQVSCRYLEKKDADIAS